MPKNDDGRYPSTGSSLADFEIQIAQMTGADREETDDMHAAAAERNKDRSNKVEDDAGDAEEN